MKKWILLLFCFSQIKAQELYIFSEPASNMPANSVSFRLTSRLQQATLTKRLEQRHSPEIMLGLNKNWMIHTAATFSDMYNNKVEWESVRTYAKYRFYTKDELYRHFRLAVFAEGSFSRNDPFYDEISLEGDQSGVQAGLIATQLLHKLAVSTTVSVTQVLHKWRNQIIGEQFPFQSLNYSLSVGYLVFPKEYVDYKQTNLNVYAELLGQNSLDKKLFYVDIASGVQLIFNSQAKLNIGYRVQLNDNMNRMSNNNWLISFEYLLLNALKRKE